MGSPLRFVPGWKRLLFLAAPLALALGGVAGARAYSSFATTPPGAVQNAPANAGLDIPPPAGLLVDVIGAVANPGLYRL
ncbi:MAG: hypothetical protein WB682_06765, partial [Candidatus Dormiibacterota bacterium]